MIIAAKHKYLRLITAIYFALLGTFCIVMELSHDGLSLFEFCIYAFLFMPLLVPFRLVRTMFGVIVSLIFAVLLLNGLGWFVQYLNGAYFKYPLDTFVVGFPFIGWTLLCGVLIGWIGLTGESNISLRIKRAE